MATLGRRAALLLGCLALHAAVFGLESNARQETIPTRQEDEFKVSVERAVKFYLITRDSPDGKLVQLGDESLLANGPGSYNKSNPTTIIIHGYGHDIHGGVFSSVAGALLRAGTETNVLAVDWGELCRKPFYVTARNRVAAVGGRVAALIDYLVAKGLARLAELHLIGHSLGAHVAGNAGKACQENRPTKVARITGLDPAGPLFSEASADRLAPGDAELVDVIHTCVGLLGYRQPLGHVDFYPNGGKLSQPGCSFIEDRLKFGHCSHARSYELFAESVLDDKAFPASKCDSYKSALSKSCPARSSGLTAVMGQHLQYSEPGVYFLRTRGASPFSLNN